jgi:hypothetical protein
MTFLLFRPAIDGMLIISQVFGKYSFTSSPFCMQLLLLDFYDVPQAISNISSMCTRSAESYAVGYMDKYGMTVAIQIDSSCALTTLSMRCMKSIT